MEHEEAQALIADRARGRLESALAAEVDKHLRKCDECRQTWEASTALETEIRSRGPEYLSPHPPADEVAAYAIYPDRLSAAQLGTIGLHVRACPICEAEVLTSRRALRGAWWRGWRAGVFGTDPQPIRTLLAPALAVLAIALIYPAYIGTIRYPEAMRERDRARASADSLLAIGGGGPGGASSQLPPTGLPSDGIASLVLAGPSRGASPASPVVRKKAGQALLHVVIDHPAAAEARLSNQDLEITIVAAGAAEPVWRVTAPAQTLWDEGLQAAGFVVPLELLAPGTYRLELRVESGAPAFRADFRVDGAAR
jgi:hypothetical protein